MNLEETFIASNFFIQRLKGDFKITFWATFFYCCGLYYYNSITEFTLDEFYFDSGLNTNFRIKKESIENCFDDLVRANLLIDVTKQGGKKTFRFYEMEIK